MKETIDEKIDRILYSIKQNNSNIGVSYIDSINVSEYYCFSEKFTIIPKAGINLIVGDQGCGKSTLLYGLQCHKNFINVEISEKYKNTSISTFYFDTEKMNPRTTSIDNYTRPDGRSKGYGVGNALASHFKSHGETLVDFTVNALSKAENSIIFLDEPESALSPRNQYKLIQALNKAVSNNCQIFIATHCIPLIESQDVVYDLESKEWVTSQSYLNSHRI
jgi:predicted ATPase